jgi:hypothetical protein
MPVLLVFVRVLFGSCLCFCGTSSASDTDPGRGRRLRVKQIQLRNKRHSDEHVQLCVPCPAPAPALLCPHAQSIRRCTLHDMVFGCCLLIVCNTGLPSHTLTTMLCFMQRRANPTPTPKTVKAKAKANTGGAVSRAPSTLPCARGMKGILKERECGYPILRRRQ